MPGLKRTAEIVKLPDRGTFFGEVGKFRIFAMFCDKDRQRLLQIVINLVTLAIILL